MQVKYNRWYVGRDSVGLGSLATLCIVLHILNVTVTLLQVSLEYNYYLGMGVVVIMESLFEKTAM